MSRARDLADGNFSGDLEADSPTFVVDSANNRVGIGTTSPSASAHVYDASSDAVLYVDSGNANGSHMRFLASGAVKHFVGSGGGFGLGDVDDFATRSFDNILFSTGNSSTERMRIDSSGNLLVGVTSVLDVGANTNVGISFGAGIIQSSNNGASTLRLQRTGTDGYISTFYRDTSLVGNIYLTGSSTSYNTSSDYRLKENITPLDGAADRLAQIPVHRFNFIADPETTVDGFLAHEVQAFVPEAITGEKDAVEIVEIKDEDGNVTGTEERPVYQGIDQSKLVPLLTAALQEALQKIDALEARVATLEGGA